MVCLQIFIKAVFMCTQVDCGMVFGSNNEKYPISQAHTSIRKHYSRIHPDVKISNNMEDICQQVRFLIPYI